MTTLLLGTVASLAGWLVFRYGKHPACVLGVIPFLVGMAVASAGLDKALEHDRYYALGYMITILVGAIALLIYNGRHKYRAGGKND